jgi:hypothetical protein
MADPWTEPEPEPADIDPEPPVDINELELGDPLKRVRFQFRHQDQDILERIRVEADELFAYMFTEAIEQMNAFYASLRIGKRSSQGVVIHNSKGEIEWEKDSSGNYIEDWNQLTGQEVEQIYMNLEKIKIFLTPTIHKLKMEAMWAQIAAGDAKDEARVKVATGLAEDKSAKANRGSREDRYLAFFKYYLWSTSNVFYDQIVDFMWKLRDVRNWRIQSQT